MQSGLLNKIIHVYRPTISQNEYGEQVQLYNHHLQTRARVDRLGGSRTTSNDEIIFSYTKTFKVWNYVDVKETDYIMYDGKKWRITSIDTYPEYNEKVINTELINE